MTSTLTEDNKIVLGLISGVPTAVRAEQTKENIVVSMVTKAQRLKTRGNRD